MGSIGNHFHQVRFVFCQFDTCGKILHIFTADKDHLGFGVIKDIGNFRRFEHIVDGAGDRSQFLGTEHGIIDFRRIEDHCGNKIPFNDPFFFQKMGHLIGTIINCRVAYDLVIIEDQGGVWNLPGTLGYHLCDAFKLELLSL